MAYQTPMTVKETLDRISRDRLVLPAIQREFVWVSDTDRMARLFDSLLRGYPIGTFLFWDVPADQSQTFDFYGVLREWHERDRRHNPRVRVDEPRDLTAVLDGQQRLTTLNIGLRGTIAQRTKWRRASSSDAYPARQLYLDLLFEPGEDDEFQYRFAFLTREQAVADSTAHWFRVPDVMQVAESTEWSIDYVDEHVHDDRRREAGKVLRTLWRAVHEVPVISAFEEKGESLSRVLDIFVRVNSGGLVLSKSDLLLSVATAHFTTRDAREEIHGLVDDLNREGAGFEFSKDAVLKAGMLLTGISDIGFKVENFTAANMRRLEQSWDEVAAALHVAVRLLVSFGFSAGTLPAGSVLIPLADYAYQRRLGPGYVDSSAYATDRRTLKDWVIRTILKPGVWGSGLDGLLRALHRQIAESHGGFPVQAIEAEMARLGKSLRFDGDLVDDLVDTPYRHPRAFALLTLLYDTVGTVSRFHVDHVFPRALATRAKLLGAGVDPSDVDEIRDKVERLGNLQLLRGADNIDKRATLPADWIASMFPDTTARDVWLAGNDLLNLPADARGFLAFYERRRTILRARLEGLLGAVPGAAASAVAEPGPVAVELPEAPVQPARPALANDMLAREAPHAPHQPRRRSMFAERLPDLLADGRIHAGEVLHGQYHGARHECTVEPGGVLRYRGTAFSSPSGAAKAVSGGTEVDGWEFWLTERSVAIGKLRNR